jgi:nitrate reductase assembly molybdenum cofactor insertion protein NarJ
MTSSNPALALSPPRLLFSRLMGYPSEDTGVTRLGSAAVQETGVQPRMSVEVPTFLPLMKLSTIAF